MSIAPQASLPVCYDPEISVPCVTGVLSSSGNIVQNVAPLSCELVTLSVKVACSCEPAPSSPQMEQPVGDRHDEGSSSVELVSMNGEVTTPTGELPPYNYLY